MSMKPDIERQQRILLNYNIGQSEHQEQIQYNWGVCGQKNSLISKDTTPIVFVYGWQYWWSKIDQKLIMKDATPVFSGFPGGTSTR